MKILCSDYDGTLRINQMVSDQDIQAIAKFQQAGNKFGIVTGRGYGSILSECQHYGIKPDFFVCNNGGAVFKADGEMLFIANLAMDLVADIINIMIDHQVLGYSLNDGKKRAEKNLSEQRKQIDHQVDMSVEDILANEVVGQIVGFVEDKNQALALSDFLSSKYPDQLDCYANITCVDVVKKGCSKASGIKIISEALGYDAADIYCVGDALNDVSMIETYHGYAMQNGVDEVKQLAKQEVSAVNELIEVLLNA